MMRSIPYRDEDGAELAGGGIADDDAELRGLRGDVGAFSLID
jgi:hypothetical protein